MIAFIFMRFSLIATQFTIETHIVLKAWNAYLSILNMEIGDYTTTCDALDSSLLLLLGFLPISLHDISLLTL